MERELVGLLGAGLTSFATGYGVIAPVGAIDAGYTMVDVISREGGPRVGATINGMVQTLWLDWQQTGLDRATLAAHAGALPAIIELNRPPPEAFVRARDSDDGGRTLAVMLIERARRSGDITRAGLDEGIVYALLERLYAAMLTVRETLPELISAIDLYLQTDLWRQDATSTAPAVVQPTSPALPDPKSVAQLAIGAFNGVRAAVVNASAGMAGSEIEARFERHCALLATLSEKVAILGHRAASITGPAIDAARLMAAGEFAAADRALSAAEQVVTRRATSNLASAREMMHLACEILDHRATLAEIVCDDRRAARHLQTATRCLTSADSAAIWVLRVRQAEALVRLDAGKRDDAAFADAIRALADASVLDPGTVGRESWAEAQLRLAAMLVELGHRRDTSADLIKAVQHAEAGLRGFIGAGKAAEIERARLTLGRTQWQAGDRASDAQLLERAVATLHESLSTCPRESDPVRWVEISSLLGQALLRLSTLRGEPKLLPPAIAQLRGAVQFAATCNVPIDALASETALGRALLGEFASGGESLVLDLAATAFRRALKSATLARDTPTCAGLRHELGMTLWAVADRAGDANVYPAAIEALEASLVTYESIGDVERAAAVRTDLARLQDVAGAAPATAVRAAPQPFRVS